MKSKLQSKEDKISGAYITHDGSEMLEARRHLGISV
jgi:hypothetical protein